jgi:hypothetical protein
VLQRLQGIAGVVCLAAWAATGVWAADPSQQITTNAKVKIPGSDLNPGTYTFAVEDRLNDRAIVRITSQDGNKHFLVLTVPNPKLQTTPGSELIYFFSDKGGDQVLHGWNCPGCTEPLEFVYPKAEAAKITDRTAESVLAVDPTYDKLPVHLSEDDMKVVTLWLLSPERITAAHKGSGVAAEKYAEVLANRQNPGSQANAPSSTLAQTSAPAAQPGPNPAPVQDPVQMASAATTTSPSAESSRQRRRALPHTASNTFLYAFIGLVFVLSASVLRLARRWRAE